MFSLTLHTEAIFGKRKEISRKLVFHNEKYKRKSNMIKIYQKNVYIFELFNIYIMEVNK